MLLAHSTTKPLRCYFSLRSPYSWLALRTLDKAGFGIGSALDYLPYFEPSPAIAARLRDAGGDFLYAPMGKERSLYILGDIKRSAHAEGLQVKWPVDVSPDWTIPHLAYLACESADLRRAFVFAAMDARWLRGENLWCWDKAAELLAAVTTPDRATEVVQRARSDETAQQAVDVLFQAYLDGVFGVPFLLAGREKFWGNDRVALFLETLQSKACV